jgi:hypothetical protein
MPEMKLVGVLAYSANKDGVDAGTLAGIDPIGVKATTKFDRFLKLDAECVIYTSKKEDAEKNIAVAMMAENYLKQPIIFFADKLGISIDRIERTSQLKTTPIAIKTPAMEVAAGTVGLVSYAWTAYSKGKPFYTTEVYWYLGRQMRPESATCDDFWTVEIEGRPSLRATVAAVNRPEQVEKSPPGYITTIVTMLQAVPGVVAAKPGLMSPALPEFHWKPDQRI